MLALPTAGRLGASRIALAKIDEVVASKLGLTRVRGNAQPATLNRQIAMYLAKRVGGWSTTRIGRFYNGRDHSTVCHAIKKIQVLRERDPAVDGLLSELTKEIDAVSHSERRNRDMPETLANLQGNGDTFVLTRLPGI